MARKTAFPLLRALREPRSRFYFQFGNREEQGANLSNEDGNIFLLTGSVALFLSECPQGSSPGDNFTVT